MRRLKYIVITLLAILAIVQSSCTELEGDKINRQRIEESASIYNAVIKQVQSDTAILRGRCLSSGIISPIYTTVKDNVYKVGDTVWVYTSSNKISNSTWDIDTGEKGAFKAFIIEQDNDVSCEYQTRPEQIKPPR